LFFPPEPLKESCKREVAKAVAHGKSEVKGIASRLCETKSKLLVSKWFKQCSAATEYHVYI